MIYEDKIYNIFTKSKLIGIFSEKIVDKDLMGEVYNTLQDPNTFSRYIFNVLEMSCVNMKSPLADFNTIKENFGNFFRDVIVAVQEISGLEIDTDLYVDFWLYMIMCESNNEVITLEDRFNILSDLYISKKIDSVELYFQILYLGEYMDVLMREQPIKLDLLKELTHNLSLRTQEYNML